MTPTGMEIPRMSARFGPLELLLSGTSPPFADTEEEITDIPPILFPDPNADSRLENSVPA